MSSYIAARHIDSVAVSPAGDRLVLGLSSLDGNIWDGGVAMLSRDGHEICTKVLPTGVSMVRFSGSKVVLAARDDGDVAVYSADDLKELQLLSAHDDIVSCVADDPHNDSQFATCGWDGCIHLWDWTSNHQKPAPLQSYILAHHGHVNEATFSCHNPHLLNTVGQDGFLRIWDRRKASASNCACIVDLGQVGSCVASTMNDHALLVGTDAGHVVLVDVRSVSSATASTSSSSSSSTSSTTSVGILSSTPLHKTRVRRIIRPFGGSNSSNTNSSSSSAPVGDVVITASDDATYAVSSISATAPNESVVRELKRYLPLSCLPLYLFCPISLMSPTHELMCTCISAMMRDDA